MKVYVIILEIDCISKDSRRSILGIYFKKSEAEAIKKVFEKNDKKIEFNDYEIEEYEVI